MKTISASILFLLLATQLLAADAKPISHALELAKPGAAIVADDFTQQEKPNRRLTRGEWKVADGVAVCVQDEDLFKKYKNHGPAIWYDQSFQNAIIRFEMQPSRDCAQFVFTINGKDGHVFRFVMNEIATDVRAWGPNHESKRLASGGPPLAKDAWIPVTVELVGKEARVQIGDKYQVQIADDSYAAEKTVVGVSFHHGSLKLRNFAVHQAAAK